jgi:hypothetical protein
MIELTSKERLQDHMAEAHGSETIGRSKAELQEEHGGLRCGWRSNGPASSYKRSRLGRRRQVQMQRAWERQRVSRETVEER